MGPRFALPLILLVTLTALSAAADARAGTYLVRQCHNSAPQNHAHEGIVDVSPNPGPYAVAAGPGVCAGAANEYAIQARPSASALHGQYGLTRFIAPEGTKLIGVELDARLRSEAGHRARLSMANAAGIEGPRFGAGTSGPTGFTHYEWSGTGYQQFTAGLTCDNPGFNCPMAGNGDKSKADIRNLRLTVRDDVAPEVKAEGELIDGGWVTGARRLVLTGTDRESGLYFLATAVNGAIVSGASPLPCQTIAGTTDAIVLSPCARDTTANLQLDTNLEPFVDGDNDVIACAVDFGRGGNSDCHTDVIKVDNTQPYVLFKPGQTPDDPELIRAGAHDATSGLARDTGTIEYRAVGTNDWLALPTELRDGELKARVDSGTVPPGNYEFQASVADVAGNQSSTTLREDGQPMVLTFPLKEATSLRAELGNGNDDQTVRFRRDGQVAGRLLDERGDPIAGATINVVEIFDEGSLIDRRFRQVETNDRGRYRSRLPGGPSRDVKVAYAGSRRYMGRSTSGLDFDVRGAAQLKTSKRKVRAGRAVTFRGRVKRYFARIPPGGKLVEVQVKNGNDWTTVQEAKGTNAKGRIKLRHRFRGFYTQPVTFTFRLKARRESGWPYRGAAKSKRRRVTVLPKRRR